MQHTKFLVLFTLCHLLISSPLGGLYFFIFLNHVSGRGLNREDGLYLREGLT